MKKIVHNSVVAATVLGVFSLLGTGLVITTFENTKQQIISNEKIALLASLKVLLPESGYDNDIIKDTILITDSRLDALLSPVKVYRARKEGKPVAVIVETIAQEGYNGRIKLLVGIKENGVLAGVRVIVHQETPGLGDKVDASHSDWVLNFSGKSIVNPDQKNWGVKRDGGKFDQFTGATITPRAVVKAVKNTLLFYQDQKTLIFTTARKNHP